MPLDDNYKVTTYKLDGSKKSQKFSEVYNEKKDGIILRLICQHEELTDCPCVDEVVIKELIPMKKGETEQ